MEFAYSCHNSQTLRATNMRVWWVLLLASACLGDDCSDIPCEATGRHVCGYDKTNNLNALFVDNCVLEECNCRYEAVGSSARFVTQDAKNCTEDPYVSLIDECSPDNSREGGSQEMENLPSKEVVRQPKDSDSLAVGDLTAEDSLEDENVTKGEEEIVSDILDTSKDEIVPILTMDPPKKIVPLEVSAENDSGSQEQAGSFIIDSGRNPPKEIDPLDPLEVSAEDDSGIHEFTGPFIIESGRNPPKEIDPLGVSAEDDSGSHEETGPFIIESGRNPPPFPPPLVLDKIGSILLQGLSGDLEKSAERIHEPSSQTIIKADIDVNVYIDEKMPFPPHHHKHHGHHPHEDSQELGDKPTYEERVPLPFQEPELPNPPTIAKFPLPFDESELPIPSAVQYPTAGTALPRLDVLAMFLTSILAILWNRY